MAAYVMLVYVWAGSTPSFHTQDFASRATCEAARDALLGAVEAATQAEPVPRPAPVVICAPR